MPDNKEVNEYESAAEYKAHFDKLPELISSRVMELINSDPDEFEKRVRAYKYAKAMEKIYKND